MIKNYTDKDYADKAVEANKQNKKLYILVTPTEFEKDVLDFTTETVKQPVYDENGQEIGTENVEIQVPVMIEKEVPIYDENGEQIGTETITVQSSHKEKYMEDVATLVLAEADYYICYEDNYTDGTINENFEQEQAEKERQRLNLLNLTKADVLLALYQDKGLTPDDIKSMLKDNVPALIKFDYASSYYRGDDVVNALGLALGYSTEEMDYLFKNKSFPPKVEEPADTDSDSDTDIDSDTDTDLDSDTDNEESEVVE